MHLPIYLDYAATTPVAPEVINKMLSCLGENSHFGNAASQGHCFGLAAAELIDAARTQVAELINAQAREIIWTSGATEANNLAIKGAATFYQRKGKHIITLKTEHKSVLDTCAALAEQGFEITYLAPAENGVLELSDLQRAIRTDTILISIMHANNETGVIQNIQAMAALAKGHGIIFHVDAVQTVGKIPIDISKIPLDLMSISAHKLYGPKGMGALYVRRQPRVRINAQIHGGGHEFGLRSGTLATHQIVGMGEACALAKQRLQEDYTNYQQLNKILCQRLSKIAGVQFNGDLQQRIPTCLNVSFAGIDSEVLRASLPEIAISGGAACTSSQQQASHVLIAMGLTQERALHAIRISIGRSTTLLDIEFAVEKIAQQVKCLRI